MPLIRGELIEVPSGDAIATHVAGRFVTVATVNPPTAQLFDKLWQCGYKLIHPAVDKAPGPKGMSYFLTFKER
uniref:Uncharacterized protein n=1 Tax=Pseudomonas phage RVTF4 TaxID=3236931 RepID=A0AB39CDH2_9VIRU